MSKMKVMMMEAFEGHEESTWNEIRCESVNEKTKTIESEERDITLKDTNTGVSILVESQPGNCSGVRTHSSSLRVRISSQVLSLLLSLSFFLALSLSKAGYSTQYTSGSDEFSMRLIFRQILILS